MTSPVGPGGEERSRDSSASLRELLPTALPQIEQFVRRHFPRTLRDQESVSDVVDSVCVDLLADDMPFDYRGAPEFRGWLDTVVLCKIRARLRLGRTQKHDRNRLVEFKESQHGHSDVRPETPSQLTTLREHLSLLDRALTELPDHYREVIVRRHLRGHTRSRIAQDLGLTAAATQNRIARAKARLAGIMDRLTQGER